MKLLVISPHLSTGGSPQYTLEYLRAVKKNYEAIKLIEFSNFSSVYTVQKNKIIDLLRRENVITLGEYGDDDHTFFQTRMKLLDIIRDFNPERIWMGEMPECYEYRLPPERLMEELYSPARQYRIIETTHNNSFDFNQKRYFPDAFMFCDVRHIEQSSNIHIAKTVWEYPIPDRIRPNRKEILESLGLNPNYLHVLNVGLLSHNKNQKYIYDLAKKFTRKNIQFHFIGNDCFLNNSGITDQDWRQENCKWWGERSDVDVFMSCMDIYLFPSRKELNPLTIKEALSWKMEVIVNKDVYTERYENLDNFHILQNIDIERFLQDCTEEKVNSIVSSTNTEEMVEKQEKPSSLSGKFLITCSFYNNTAEHIKQTFDNIINQTHTNWVLIVTDDFSTNDCKSLLKEELLLRNHPNIILYEPKERREIYLYQNLFKGIEYDYLLDLDVDDKISSNLLEIYDYHFRKYPDIFSIFCDLSAVAYDTGNLQRISAVKKCDNVVETFKELVSVPLEQVTAKYSSNFLYGHARCFRKIDRNSLERVYNGRSSADSYCFLSTFRYGNHLHLPRNLYTWILRPQSDSSTIMSAEEHSHYNDNAFFALSKCNPEFKQSSLYDSVWLETTAISYSNLDNLKAFSIISDLSPEDQDSLQDLYFDKQLVFNEKTETCIIVWNKLDSVQKIDILKFLQENPLVKFSIYCFFDDFNVEPSDISKKIEEHANNTISIIKEYISLRYFIYYRHLIIQRY